MRNPYSGKSVLDYVNPDELESHAVAQGAHDGKAVKCDEVINEIKECKLMSAAGRNGTHDLLGLVQLMKVLVEKMSRIVAVIPEPLCKISKEKQYTKKGLTGTS